MSQVRNTTDRSAPFLKRLLTSFILAPLFLYAFVEGEWVLRLLLIIICVQSLKEFYIVLSLIGMTPNTLIGYFISIILLLKHDIFVVWFIALVVITVAIAIFGSVVRQYRYAVSSWVATVAPACYVSICLYFALLLRHLEEGELWLILAGVAVALFDAFSFFSGRLIGRTKIASKVSPGKTWEGFVGGTLACLAFTLLYTSSMGHVTTTSAVLLSILLSFTALIGDLFASLFKRAAMVKDFGDLLPGHGGMLDRIDGFLPVLPVSYLLIELLNFG